MAVTFVWDAAFDAAPPNTLVKSLIDDNIRTSFRGIRERMECEHMWGPFTDEDTGRHRPGYVTVLDKGNAGAMAGVVNPQEGALYLMTDGADLQVHIYTGGAWVKLSSVDHDLLTGRDDNDHPWYLRRDGGTLQDGDLDLGGFVLETPEAAADKYGGFTLFRHRSAGHASLGNIDVIADGILTSTEIKISQHEVSGALADGAWLKCTMVNCAFFPQVCVSGAYDKDIWILPGTDGYEIGLANESGGARNFRIRDEAVEAA